VALEPLQESVHRTLMRLYVELGRRGAALRQYQACVAALQRGLRVEPEAQTRALYEEILRQRPPGTGAASAVETPATDARAGFAAPAWTEILPRDGALVGREGEMDGLRGALEQTDLGRGRIVAVLGEAGVGKSRLVAELAAEASQRGWRVLVGRAYEAEGGLPLGPWVDALRSSGVARDAAVRELAPAWRAGLSRLLPDLAEAGPTGGPDSDDRLLVFGSVAEAVTALAARRPLLLVLEDLHWADGASLRLLGFVGRRLPRARVLVVLTARDEEIPDAAVLSEVLGDLDRQGRLDRLPLGALSREVSVELIRVLAPEIQGESAETVAERVWAASHGNPFVLIETLRQIRADVPGLPPGAVAPRVKDVITRRLGRLTDGARELMRTAAVFGREAEFRVLQEASGLEEGEAARAVEELVRSRVIVAQGERFDFVHDRIRQVVHGELLPPRRRLIHRRIAEALERLYHDKPEAQAGALGLHFLGAEVWDRATDYLRLAAETARQRSGYRESVRYLEQALEAVSRLPDGPDTLTRAFDVRFDLIWPLSTLNQYARVLELAVEAEALAARLGDTRRVAWARSFRCFASTNTGRIAAALDVGRTAVEMAAELDDPWLEVEASMRLAMAHLEIGQLARAIESFRRIVEVLSREDAERRLGESRALAYRSHVWGRLGAALADAGAIEESLAYGEEALRYARRLGRPVRMVSESTWLGRAHVARGAPGEAIPLLEEGLALARRWEILDYLPWTMSDLALAYALAGRLADAVPLAEDAARLERTNPRDPARLELTSPRIARQLGEVYLRADRVDAAQEAAEHALVRARNDRGPVGEGRTLRLLGDIAARREPPDVPAAEARYREALALLAPLGYGPDVARCHRGLGRLLGRAGRAREAEEHLATASRMEREMGIGG
jgi:tetratricopeptide (TPR) repeat protein